MVRTRLAQFLMIGPLGALVSVACIAFSISEGLHGPVDYVVAPWAFLLGLANLYVGVLLGSGRPGIHRAAIRVALVNVVFSLVKLVHYDESASLVFIGIDAALLALLAGLEAGRPRPSARPLTDSPR